MNKGGGGDQCVAELFWVRDGKLGGEAGGCDIDGMDAAGECGKNLARIEGEIAFSRLLERLPGLRLVDTKDVTYKPTITLRGPVSLPAVWQ